MEILISAHERFTDPWTELEAKRAAQEKLEALEQEHFDALKRVNHKIAETKNERGSAISNRRGPSNLSSKGLGTTRSRTSNETLRASSTIDRKTETAVKMAKLKTELGEKDIRFEEVPAYWRVSNSWSRNECHQYSRGGRPGFPWGKGSPVTQS